MCVCVGVLVICVLVFIVFCIFVLSFLYCFVYVYLFLLVLSVLVYRLLPPSDNSIAVSNKIIIIIMDWIGSAETSEPLYQITRCNVPQ
jgi:hypothetical protein